MLALRVLAPIAAALVVGSGCKKSDTPADAGVAPPSKILHGALRAKVGTIDPVRCGSQYDAAIVAAIYDPLLRYRYLVHPYTLAPNLLASMPDVSADGLTYTFRLAPGVTFHDDPVFAEGRGRELVADDVLYSIRRMADRDLSPGGWWIYDGRIRGFDAFRAKMNERPAGAPFDHTTPIEGLERVDRHTLRIHLVRPFPQLLHVLATCWASVVPREAAERYDLSTRAVGSGPFRLVELLPGTKVVLAKNEHFRDERFPTLDDVDPGTDPKLLVNAGKRLPLVDGVVMHVFEQDQPMWLAWRAKDLDFVQTPAAFFDSAFDPITKALRPELTALGVTVHRHAKLDFIYRGFDLEDPIVGGSGKGKLVRQAISLALDTRELSDAFYAGTAVPYDGPIPPGLDGHAAGVISKYRGPKLDEARALLAKAGYPDGKGLPPIRYHTNRGGNAPEQAEMITRQLRAIGVTIAVELHAFPELDALVKKGKAQMFHLSWGSDYPDAQNNLALFYGGNVRPGPNVFAYRSAEFDRRYEAASVLPPSPERTKLYEEMRDLVIEDAPAVGGLARTRYYVMGPRVRGLAPDETWFGWIRYAGLEAE
ncbi:ABC transporter substrate-binding protein [Myxococcota bacterium]|nr:ABC transporter substrate-binding protein [Myxococcota bacterium]